MQRRIPLPVFLACAAALAFVAGLAYGAARSHAAGGTQVEAAEQAGAPEQNQSQKQQQEPKRPKLLRADAQRRTVFLDGKRKAEFELELGGEERRDLVVKAIKLSKGKSVRRWKFEGVDPGQPVGLRWNGKRKRGRGFTGQGRHAFKVYEKTADGLVKADANEAEGRKRFRFYKHHFPLPGPHTYGDGLGAGRGHQGFDIFADCGRKIRAARGGKVQFRGNHSAAGRYLVIDGRGTERDYVYMHLKKRGRPQEGERVRTGERIGFNGKTGNASGCHLHFEVWTGPGWYEGGSPMKLRKRLERWDGWS